MLIARTPTFCISFICHSHAHLHSRYTTVQPAGRGRGGRRGRGRGGSNFDVEIFAGKHSKETGLVIHVQSGNSSTAPEGVGSESNTPAVSGDSAEIVAGGVVAESMDA